MIAIIVFFTSLASFVSEKCFENYIPFFAKLFYNPLMAQTLWSWEAAQFEKIEASDVLAGHVEESWHVTMKAPNRAWGYRIALPDEARMFIMWRTTLEITKVDGEVHPGLAYFMGGDGVSIQIDMATQKAELRHVMHTMETKCVAEFRAPAVTTPFEICIEMNVITRVLIGTVAGKRAFHVKLPYRALPAFEEITDVEILTTTPPTSTGGTASYGALTLQCE